jgi:uncharacterized repeat protein (TIGR01451 family)
MAQVRDRSLEGKMRSQRVWIAVVGFLLMLLMGSSALAWSGPTEERVSIAKAAQPRNANPGDIITYTLTLSNPLGVALHGLMVTDTLPSETTFGKLLSEGQGVYDEKLDAVLWSGSLPPGGSREISFTVSLTTAPITNTLIINQVLLDDGQQISRAWDWTLVGSSRIRLPLALRDQGPPPPAPVLDEIQAPGVQPSYQVTWSAVPGAVSYLLQQDLSADFPAPADIYSGAETSTAIESRGIQTYYYRVKAYNPFIGGDWSNTRSAPVFWEDEPNDPWDPNANGALVSGATHYGYQNDWKDFFWFDAGSSGTIRIILTNPSATGVQLQLFFDTATVENRRAYRTSPPYAIEYVGEAGRYYVYIYSTGGYNQTQPYSLWVQYPQ